MARRNTIQKQLVLNTVKKLNNHPTADEVYNHIVESYPGISKATIYRNLNNLAEEGQLLKLTMPGAADKYDATLGRHYHAICKYCEKIMDIALDEPINIDFDQKSMKELQIDEYVILFKGVCPECRNRLRNDKKSD
jgi:Fe2+ or Zn2+ uptake regulation protein